MEMVTPSNRSLRLDPGIWTEDLLVRFVLRSVLSDILPDASVGIYKVSNVETYIAS